MTIDAGIVGLGWWGNRLVEAVQGRSDRIRFVHGVARDPAAKQEIARRHGLVLSPTLAAMLSDPLLQYRYLRHLDNLITLAGKEVERTRWQPEFAPLARMYLDRFHRAREVFVNQYGNNLVNGFRRFFETGKLELITCGATHGFLPLMTTNQFLPSAMPTPVAIPSVVKIPSCMPKTSSRTLRCRSSSRLCGVSGILGRT